MHTDNVFFRMLSRALLLAFVIGSLGMVSACDEQGPAEEAGEQLDESIEESADALEEAGDEIEESTEY
ncbi:MAG TPA: hypothetical protein VFM76_09060 [Methylophaga sp.]|nr:hypothetical protein [Methylophaga sp.]